jgi:transposase InsO family protein
MSLENTLWGAPHIHGELLKLGFTVAQSTVARYMAKPGDGRSGQSWSTFLRNHLPDIAAIDLFVVPTIGFRLLYALVIVRLARRELVWINVTAHPSADWIAQQITEAFPWDEAPRYLIRDRDAVYGAVVTRRLRAMGIRDKPISAGSPWQNGFAERLIGTIRRECVDHLVVFGEAHLRRVLIKFAAYYNECRIHRSLNKDAPFHRAIERLGAITARPVSGRPSSPILSGLTSACQMRFSVHTGCASASGSNADTAVMNLARSLASSEAEQKISIDRRLRGSIGGASKPARSCSCTACGFRTTIPPANAEAPSDTVRSKTAAGSFVR